MADLQPHNSHCELIDPLFNVLFLEPVNESRDKRHWHGTPGSLGWGSIPCGVLLIAFTG